MRSIPTHDFSLPVMPCYHREVSRGENGYVSYRQVEDVGELPPPENYDIGNLIKAGVPLSVTRTNIMAVGDSELLEHLENDEFKTETKKEDLKNE